MGGNVWQWVEDCYRDSYAGAPVDGSALTTADCPSRVLRGGSWNYTPPNLRAADRRRYSLGTRDDDISFRVARTPG
jgi:formylglycine-generating enzyme required for sulfatase activity